MPSKKISPRREPTAASTRRSAAGPLPAQASRGKPVKERPVRQRLPGPAGTEPETAPRKPPRPAGPFSVVGIGASAGGLEALEELFHPMPLDTGLAFVVVTHQHPGHTSMLAELLGRITRLSVVEAADGMKVKPNHIYISPPGGYLAILGGTLHRMETGQPAAPHLPMDYFFRSLAEDQKEKAIAVILSGTGTDGTAGLQAIKNESGVVIVQDAASAKFSGMPESAVASGLADHVLPPAGIVRQLVAGPRSGAHPDPAADAEESFAGPMGQMLVVLRARTGHDFSSYKSSTIRRRIERRMNLNGIIRPMDYVRYLEGNPHEADLLFKDPPFTKLDLISCRNVMIYLNAELQRWLLPVFHHALKPGGLLFLGPSETIGGASDLFGTVDRKWKIHRRRESALPSHPVLGFTAVPERTGPEARPAAAAPARDTGISNVVERLLLTRFTPASVVVNERGDVVYIHGRTGNYLEPASGQPRLNVLAMAREGLQLELAAALRQAVAREGIRVRTNGSFSLVDVSIFRLDEPEAVRGLWMITFRSREAPPQETGKGGRTRKAGERELTRTKELERELLCTRETLQTTIEELETSNEELKSTNEELQSTNEELQSTNEELETSKEEMQSLNEELTTVNAELQAKVEDMARTNDDMQNLLNSTEIATVFLDAGLKIKRYTEQARRLINLIQTDIGRPVSNLVSSLTYDLLTEDCHEVLRSLVFKQAEVRTRDGHWYLMRIMPYRTAENVIDGLVLTFVDINPVKEAEKSLLRMSKVFLDGPEPMIIVDLSGRIIDLNKEAARVHGWSRQEMLGHSFRMTVPGSDGDLLEARLRGCLAGEVPRATACTLINKTGSPWKGVLMLLLLADEQGSPEAVCMLAKNHETEPTPLP